MNAPAIRFRFLSLVCAALLSHAQNPPAFTIAGHAVRHLEQRPAKGVRVSLAMVKDPRREVSVVAGDNGEFSFVQIPAGKYQLRVTDHGNSQLYLQDEGFSTAIVTGPGLDTEHIVFPIDSAGSLSGTIVDDDGDPAPHLQLYLFKTAEASGKDQTRFISQQTTDLEGTFRFRHLSPGTYYVAVNGRPWYAQSSPRFLTPLTEPPPHSELDVSYPLTYYSGATTFEGATPIKIDEGAKAEIHMAMHAVPALHIKLEGQTEPNRIVPFMASQSGPGGFPIQFPVMQGNSEILGLAPGNYSLRMFDQGQRRPGAAFAVSLNSDTTLNLNSERTSAAIHGKVLWNGNVPPHLEVELRNDAGMGFVTSEAVHPDGSFEVPPLLPSRYSILLSGAPETYVAKVEVKGAAYTDGQLEVPQGAQIEMLLTPGHGLSKIEGFVVQNKNPAPGAMVLLVPQDKAHGQTIHRDQSDSDGSFTLDAVTPGRYTLLAIDHGRGLAYAMPSVIAPYLEQGQVLNVPLAQAGPVQIEVQSRR